MENIQFEITHERLVALIAKHIDVPTDQIVLSHGAEEGSKVKAIVRTDLQTANKIDRKLKRREGEEQPEQPKPEQQSQG